MPGAVRRYVVAVAIVCVSAVVRGLIWPVVGGDVPFILFYPAVTLSAWYGGLGPGLVTMALSALGGWVFFFPPYGALHVDAPAAATQVALFLAGGTLICVLCESLQRATRRADETVADLRRTEGALRGSEERLRGIIDSATDAIITVGADERVRLFSSGAEGIFGWQAEEAIGQSLDRFLPERFRAGHGSHIRRFGETGVGMRPMGAERVLSAVRRDGEEFPIEARISQLDLDGEKFFTVIIRDVTERKRAERERDDLLGRERAARASAEAASRAKDEFLATVSHELRTPLSPILSWAHMLRRRVLDASKTDHALEVIERCALSQAQLIEDLLDVSRIIAGKFRLDVRAVDLAGVIRNVLDAVRPAAELKGVTLVPVVDAAAGSVSGDPERLQQVVWNLLSNAVKFTPAGGRVQVTLAAAGEDVEITVADTGHGIAPEFLPHVFERFLQADASPTRVHGGLGLGLAIVRHIVELHGGSVHAASDGPGQGAVFTVRLPRLASGRVDAGSRPRVPPGERATPAGGASLGGLRVLVVDDEPDTCEALREVLSAVGAEVRIAGSTGAAMTVLAGWTPAVLVSDIGMPGEDGYALLRRVQAWERETGSRLPSIALTAYARIEDRMKALASGFDLHLVKPVEPDELASAVARLAEGAPSGRAG